MIADLARLSPPARRLAACLSCAAFVEPALMRRMRLELVREARVGAEAEIADMTEIEARSPRGFSFGAQALIALREEVVGSADLAPAWSIVQRCHARAPALLRLEEEIVARALALKAAPSAWPAGEGDAELRAFADQPNGIEALFDDVLRAIQRPEQTRALAVWAARALGRLPSWAVDGSAARVLSMVTSAHVVAARAPSTPLTTAEVARARPLLANEPRRAPVFVRLVPGAVELRYRVRPSSGRWQTIDVVDTDPALVMVNRQGHTLESGRTKRVTYEPTKPLRLASADGREWLVLTGDVSSSIAVVHGAGVTGIGYLVHPDIAITEVDVKGSATLEFPWGSVVAEAMSPPRARDEPVVLRLASAAAAPPLFLGASVKDDDLVKTLARRDGRGDSWLQGVWVDRRRPAFEPMAGAGEVDLQRMAGAPILPLTSAHVAGHVVARAPSGPKASTRFVVRTTASIGRALERRLPRPSFSATDLFWQAAPSNDDGPRRPIPILRVAAGLFLCGPGAVRFGDALAHVDLGRPEDDEALASVAFRLWWAPPRPGSVDPPWSETPVDAAPSGLVAVLERADHFTTASVRSLRAGTLGVHALDDDDVPTKTPAPIVGSPVAMDGRIVGLLIEPRMAGTLGEFALQVLADWGREDALPEKTLSGASGTNAAWTARLASLRTRYAGSPLFQIWGDISARLPYRRLAEIVTVVRFGQPYDREIPVIEAEVRQAVAKPELASRLGLRSIPGDRRIDEDELRALVRYFETLSSSGAPA